MASRKKRRKKSSRKSHRRKKGSRKKTHRGGKGKIPLNILERRLGKLARLVKSRGGKLPR